MRAILAVAGLATAALAFQVATDPAAAQTPKRGGTLTFAVEGEPPNYDCHGGTSYVLLTYIAPHYSTLLRYDSANYPKIVGDLADSWTISPDGLTYTFKLKQGVKFHDGTPLTSADIKATYERIKDPPTGVVSARRVEFTDIQAINAPDPQTVEFKLSKRNAAILAGFANPWNCVYAAKDLAADPRSPMTKVNGTGAFQFVEHKKGESWTGKKFDGYFRQGFPYLDGFKGFAMSADALVNSVAAGQIDMSFRPLSPQEVEKIRQSRGDKTQFKAGELIVLVHATVNASRKPFDDARVRRALNLAIDRRTAIEPLAKITNLYSWGSLFRVGYEYATPTADLGKLPGFSTDINASRAEAKKLLAEAGLPNLQFVLLNRNVAVPYLALGNFLPDEWRKIGVTAVNQPVESAQYLQRLGAGDYDVAIDFNTPVVDDPSLMLAKLVPGAGNNYGRYQDQVLTDLYEKQKGELDMTVRKQLVSQFERRVLDQGYIEPLFYAGRTLPIATNVHGWSNTPSYYVGYDLTEMWKD